jgi:hypothetical protein
MPACTWVEEKSSDFQVDELLVRTPVSANRLYGFERFNLQSVQSGHVKVTFLLKCHFLEKTLPSRISGLPSVI